MPFDLDAGSGDVLAADVTTQAAGRIVIGGPADKGAASTNFDLAIARLLPNGTLDANFDSDGRATVAFDIGASMSDRLLGMALQAEGKIALSDAVDISPSSPQNLDIGIVRLQPDGSPDAAVGIAGKTLVTFDLIPNAIDYGLSIVAQLDEKLAMVGAAQ